MDKEDENGTSGTSMADDLDDFEFFLLLLLLLNNLVALALFMGTMSKIDMENEKLLSYENDWNTMASMDLDDLDPLEVLLALVNRTNGVDAEGLLAAAVVVLSTARRRPTSWDSFIATSGRNRAAARRID